MRARLPEILLACFGVSVVPFFVLLAEGVLATAGHTGLSDETSTGINLLHRYSESYGWEPRPGARVIEEGAMTTINEGGYRGRLVSRERPDDATRVLILGDSVAFGIYVSDDATYASLLDQRDNGLEAINLAVQGYGPGQSLLRLEREGLAYNPDLVLLGFCLGNDFADSVTKTFLYDGAHPKPYFTVENGRLVNHDGHLRLTPARHAALWLQERSRLYRLILRPEVGDGDGQIPWLRRRREALRDREDALETTFRIIARMRDAAAGHGAAFGVVLHPDLTAARGNSDWAGAFQGSPLLEGIPIIDLGGLYRTRRVRFNKVAVDDIGHLNAEGHLKTAEILEEVLAERGLDRRRTEASLRDTAFHPPR